MASIDNIPESCLLSLILWFFLTLSIHPNLFFRIQDLQGQIFIPLDGNLHKTFLGPMGDPNPSRTIVAETNRVPFKLSNMHLGLWDKRASIRNWPWIIIGWRNWLIKVATNASPCPSLISRRMNLRSRLPVSSGPPPIMLFSIDKAQCLQH